MDQCTTIIFVLAGHNAWLDLDKQELFSEKYLQDHTMVLETFFLLTSVRK